MYVISKQVCRKRDQKFIAKKIILVLNHHFMVEIFYDQKSSKTFLNVLINIITEDLTIVNQ